MDVSSGGKGRESFVVAGCCVAEFPDVFGELKVEVLFAGSVLGFDFALVCVYPRAAMEAAVFVGLGFSVFSRVSLFCPVHIPNSVVLHHRDHHLPTFALFIH